MDEKGRLAPFLVQEPQDHHRGVPTRREPLGLYAAAGPAGPTTTKVACAHVVEDPPAEYLCAAVVADADPGLDPPPAGPGTSGCRTLLTTSIPPGPSVISVLYFGDPIYQVSADRDQTTV